MRYLYKQITNSRQFSSHRRSLSTIKFIVIHDTGNPCRGADAMAHYRYLQGATRYGSAHYYVDDMQIIQTIGDSMIAWAVGDTWARKNRTRDDVKNLNSISIELCINQGIDSAKAYKNLLELTKNLMLKFKIPPDRIVRHYDASGKPCPDSWRKNNWAKWKKFKEDIEKPIEWKIDLSKNSEFGEKEGKPMTEPEKKNYYTKDGLKIIEVRPEDIYIAQLRGRTLREVGAYGINGTFFDTKKPELSASTWGIAINNNSPIGENAGINHPNKSIKRATMIYGDRRLTVEYANSIKDIKRNFINWAIGGVGLYPAYDPAYEKVPKDILRDTTHTGMAFRKTGNSYTVLLIVSGTCTMGSFRQKIIDLGIDGAIALDGGGSTQMFYKNNFGVHTTRKLNNVVGVKNA